MNETLVEHVLNCCAGNGFEKPITHKSRSCIKGKWLPCHDGSNSYLNRNFLSPWYEYVQSWEIIHGCKATLYFLSSAPIPWGRGTIEFAIVCPTICLSVRLILTHVCFIPCPPFCGANAIPSWRGTLKGNCRKNGSKQFLFNKMKENGSSLC